MKKIKFIAIVLIPVICIGLGCPLENDFNPDATLLIVNNSDEAIIEYRDYSDLSDTLLQLSNPFSENLYIEYALIQPGETIEIPEESEVISRLGVIHIHLISKDTFDLVSWERIRNENLILKRFDLSLEDLEAINWKVEYP